jgi:hypothetical protein
MFSGASSIVGCFWGSFSFMMSGSVAPNIISIGSLTIFVNIISIWPGVCSPSLSKAGSEPSGAFCW